MQLIIVVHFGIIIHRMRRIQSILLISKQQHFSIEFVSNLHEMISQRNFIRYCRTSFPIHSKSFLSIGYLFKKFVNWRIISIRDCRGKYQRMNHRFIILNEENFPKSEIEQWRIVLVDVNTSWSTKIRKFYLLRSTVLVENDFNDQMSVMFDHGWN